MSYYYKYNFVSPDGIYSTVKEEFKSYFDTGAIDDILFPTYLDKCLKKLGRSSYVITEDMLYLDNFEARLPDNFYAVREAWLCTETDATPYQTANSFYSQTSSTTIQISPITVGGRSCSNPNCHDAQCGGCQPPDVLEAVYKTNSQSTRSYHKEYLLRPGNISTRKNCDVSYTDLWNIADSISDVHSLSTSSSSYDSFDIRDNKFVTNFRTGAVYLIFYAIEYDNIGNQMVPDNYRVREYIEAFIKYKMFELLTNQTNDETFNQLQDKLRYYKELSDEAFIMASIELKKQTPYDKQRSIIAQKRKFNMYELPNRNNTRWRRNM
jgi:hypothetical protein